MVTRLTMAKSKNYKFKLRDIWDIENNFYLRSDKSRLNKVICHYEIFKKTINVPGKIIECGVFKGISLIRFLTFRDLLKKTSQKKVIGFDAFGKFPKQKIKEDNFFAKSHDTRIGLGFSEKVLKKILKKKKFKNFQLIKGNIEKTIPDFLRKNKNLKISFLHLDLDVFKPTELALRLLYKSVSKKGIILIDDYAQVQGATKATKNFLKINKNIKLQRLNFDKRLFFIIKK